MEMHHEQLMKEPEMERDPKEMDREKQGRTLTSGFL